MIQHELVDAMFDGATYAPECEKRLTWRGFEHHVEEVGVG